MRFVIEAGVCLRAANAEISAVLCVHVDREEIFVFLQILCIFHRIALAVDRDIMSEIRRLRLEQEQHAQVALSRGGISAAAAVQSRNPVLIAELRGLRQRRDELERRMAGLQSSRRELMTQLDGLMRLLHAVSSLCHFYPCYKSLQCFDAVGWAAGRASGL